MNMQLITNFSHKDVLLYKKAVSIYNIIDPSVVFEVRFEAYGQGGFRVLDCLALLASKNMIMDLIKILNMLREVEGKRS